jgi:rhamnogalacturonan endolyase
VARQREVEIQQWPYSWLNDTAYQSRGAVTGTIRLSDGRVGAGAAVYLGDNDTSIRPLVQGSNYYYTTTADSDGNFSFSDVRTGTYGLYIWSNGGSLADVYSNITSAGLVVSAGKTTSLPDLVWDLPTTNGRIFQVGEFDKKALGFKNGGPPYEFAIAENSPANLTYTIGTSNTSDWYFAQALLGTWTIEFDLTATEVAEHANDTGLLSVSLASYSQSAALNIDINGQLLGTLNKDSLTSDPALYRCSKTSGEWRFFQYEIGIGALVEGTNTVGFTITRYTEYRGFMWDSIVLEWA